MKKGVLKRQSVPRRNVGFPVNASLISTTDSYEWDAANRLTAVQLEKARQVKGIGSVNELNSVRANRCTRRAKDFERWLSLSSANAS